MYAVRHHTGKDGDQLRLPSRPSTLASEKHCVEDNSVGSRARVRLGAALSKDSERTFRLARS
jgi:hypothetical protein